MRWLVTGGAGYIGSHVLRSLTAAGHDAIAFDDLSTGIRSRVTSTIPFIHGDINDEALLTDALTDVDGVIHLAGLKSVSESQAQPMRYWHVNVSGMLSLLRAMRYRKVGFLLFSSTASVYGSTDHATFSETSQVAPQSVYGMTKHAAERMIEHYAAQYPLRHAVLRYFNVGGCGFEGLQDTSADNVIPVFLRRIANGEPPIIYGDDYSTRDGTCLRDYVHVSDVADAHATIAARLGRGLPHTVFNVGTGKGVTVAELAQKCLTVTDSGLVPLIDHRRSGDSAATVADVTRIRDCAGWSASRTVDEIVQSAWAHR